MSMRLFQIVAVAILVGSPVVVHLASEAVPGNRDDGTGQAEGPQEPEQPVLASAPRQASPVSMPPAPPPRESAAPAPLFDATPSLDAQGIAPVAAVDPARTSTSSPTTAAASVAGPSAMQEAPADDAPPFTPPAVPRTARY
ncbi:hypothetical protein SLG_22720 [Sphingobium sp. SYK-6]|uniref:hypothetical protein n=1 Tax=Sphingobium sp. (strain NBRC 103272 / SYK-6) TaxID=627192 RepID=UPI00022771D0|nr:hypothetical protein [Sphingobium sp. SYK-6]BAK66947.1 hypothetical protein SLG_22720 [Sphingobium sp. SYK-6]